MTGSSRDVAATDSSKRLGSEKALLLDADGTLFPSEEPAFEASAVITADFAEKYGLVGDFSAEHLRKTTTGKNFRTTSQELLADVQLTLDPTTLQWWVSREEQEVTRYLTEHLQPHPDVIGSLSALQETYRLAAVSSSALGRLSGCFSACGLNEFIPPSRRFSAENSLPSPISKPDPAIYRFALQTLGLRADEALAVEDSVTGTRSAVAAGITTIGLVEFVPPTERTRRRAELREAGAALVLDSWPQLRATLLNLAGSAGGVSAPRAECSSLTNAMQRIP